MERRDLEAQSFCCYKMKECQVVATFQYYNKKKKKYERMAFWILRILRSLQEAGFTESKLGRQTRSWRLQRFAPWFFFPQV